MSRLLVLDRFNLPEQPQIPRTDEEFCIGCGVCVKVCPVEGVNLLVKEPVGEGLFAVRADIPPSSRDTMVAVWPHETCSLAEFCIKCGKCVAECPTGARSF